MAQPNASDSEPLNVVIVGAGIGGLTAALGLRQQGHRVSLYERSGLAKEVGAAIHLAPNCHGILRRLGVFPEEFGANPVRGITEYSASGRLNFDLDFGRSSLLWQHPWMLSHRVSLHEELKRKATDPTVARIPAVLHTSSPVISVDSIGSSITLESGDIVKGDLILGADGVSSITRKEVCGDEFKPFGSGKSAFRFLIPRQRILDNSATCKLAERDGYMTLWIGDDRRLVMYPCSNNTLMNFVAIHPSELSVAKSEDDWSRDGNKHTLTSVYSEFGPSVGSLLEMADESSVKVWTLLDMDRIPRWYKGHAALLGDAAHPFLPHQGQGGGIAIEDAGSLCALLPLGTRPEEIPERLALYEQLRDERAHKIQHFTRLAGADLTHSDRHKFNIMEFTNYNYGHDEWHNSSHALKKHLWSRNSPTRRRTPLAWGPMPSPRQDHQGRPIPSETSKFTTTTIRFRTSATLLKTLFSSESFSFVSPGTVAEASFKCTQLKGMQWLGGGGYNMVGLYIHGTQYVKQDGTKVLGTYQPLLLENLADAIITGREELGMPKLFCDISVTDNVDTKRIICSWRGTTFIDLKIDGLGSATSSDEPQLVAHSNSHSKETPTAGPPEGNTNNLLFYRYIPAVGQPGVADAEYAVMVDPAASTTPMVIKEVRKGKQGQIRCIEGDSEALPTLHHIAAGLAEIPVHQVVDTKVEQGVGVDSLSGARRIE